MYYMYYIDLNNMDQGEQYAHAVAIDDSHIMLMMQQVLMAVHVYVCIYSTHAFACIYHI